MAIHLPFPNNNALPTETEDPDSTQTVHKSWMEYLIGTFGILGFVVISIMICNDKDCIKAQKIDIVSNQSVNIPVQKTPTKRNVHSLTTTVAYEHN